MNKLTSAHNPKLKAVMRLRDKRERDKTALFLIEGYRELKRALEAHVQIDTLFICPDLFLGENERALIARCSNVFEVPRHLFEKIAYRDRPDGLLAIARQMQTQLSSLTPTPGIYVVAEAIEKPGNLGTILRSSDAVGAKAVIVCDRCTDIYNPNVVRASIGTLFTLPVIEATTQDTLQWLKTHNIQIVAATPSATTLFTEVQLHTAVAIVVGTEQLGLTDTWLTQADIHVKIPMHGMADSLNVATATTLLLYEALRQR